MIGAGVGGGGVWADADRGEQLYGHGQCRDMSILCLDLFLLLLVVGLLRIPRPPADGLRLLLVVGDGAELLVTHHHHHGDDHRREKKAAGDADLRPSSSYAPCLQCDRNYSSISPTNEAFLPRPVGCFPDYTQTKEEEEEEVVSDLRSVAKIAVQRARESERERERGERTFDWCWGPLVG